MPPLPPDLLRARRDPQRRAIVTARRPLGYAGGARPALDQPGHVRAASGLLRWGRGWLVIQDDALFLGHLRQAGGEIQVEAVPLPSPDGLRRFQDSRGNKADKPDFEAVLRWPGPAGEVVLALGSGSTPRRERVLVLERGAEPRVLEAGPLYAALRAALPAEVELNIEGALRTARGDLRLLQRGNGRGGLDAVIDLEGGGIDAWLRGRGDPPVVRALRRWELGALDGVRLGFTDGAPLEGERWLFAAAAEASPNAVDDGQVEGSVVGEADEEGGAWAPLTDADGAPLPVKLEGIARRRDGVLLGVLDADDPEVASELVEIRLLGAWGGRIAER